jgi:hypothetical protein
MITQLFILIIVNPPKAGSLKGPLGPKHGVATCCVDVPAHVQADMHEVHDNTQVGAALGGIIFF